MTLPFGEGRLLVVEADGGSRGNPGPAAYGALVRDPESGRVLREDASYLGEVTNNVAEYSGLLAGLRMAHDIDPDAAIEVRMDSKLVVEQMSGRWQVKHEDMRRLVREARALVGAADVRYVWVPRARNAAADKLANEAMDLAAKGREWQPRAAVDAQPGAQPGAAAYAEPMSSESEPAVTPPSDDTQTRLAYRLLTGPDDAEFCERVSAALADGYQLHGGPAITFNGSQAIVAQALVDSRQLGFDS